MDEEEEGWNMEIKLHKNAKTTPKIREYIQKSNKSVCALSKELSLTETTVRRWKFRNEVYDRSHRPHRLCTTMTHEEEEIIVSLRQEVWLSLDDITEVMKRCVNPKLTRSAIHRCLKRRGVTKRPQESGEVTSLRKRFEKTAFGYVHIDLKHLGGIDKKPGYVFVAIERTTRYVYVEVVHKKDAGTIASCLKRFLTLFPGKIHTILTDNGSEFTDRFAGLRTGVPSGAHTFDQVCKQHQIKHKLTKPFSPQTNGMVERFNRRITEAINLRPAIRVNRVKCKFQSYQERDNFVLNLVDNYNNTRLLCLNYHSPNHMLYNHSEHYTL